LKIPWRYLEDTLEIPPWRYHLEDTLKIPWRYLEDTLMIPWRYLEGYWGRKYLAMV
jgi:hypothetical protein